MGHTNIRTLSSLGELSIELGVNKSRLNYYFSKGLLTPVARVGKMNVFDKEQAMKKIQRINDLQGKKKTLSEIKQII